MNISLDKIISLVEKVFSPLVLICVAVLLLAAYFFKAHTNFLNVRRIFKDYFALFGHERIHILVIWGIPLLIAGALVQEIEITEGSLNVVLVILSILISMFFAMLSILISKQTSTGTDDKAKESARQRLRNELLAETCTIVLIEIFLCVAVLMLSLVIVLLSEYETPIVFWMLSFCVFYILAVNVLNLLALLKRFKALIDNP